MISFSSKSSGSLCGGHSRAPSQRPSRAANKEREALLSLSLFLLLFDNSTPNPFNFFIDLSSISFSRLSAERGAKMEANLRRDPRGGNKLLLSWFFYRHLKSSSSAALPRGRNWLQWHSVLMAAWSGALIKCARLRGERRASRPLTQYRYLHALAKSLLLAFAERLCSRAQSRAEKTIKIPKDLIWRNASTERGVLP